MDVSASQGDSEIAVLCQDLLIESPRSTLDAAALLQTLVDGAARKPYGLASIDPLCRAPGACHAGSMTLILALVALGIVVAVATMWGSRRNDALRRVDPRQAQQIDAIRSFGFMGQSQRPRRDGLPKL